MQEPGTSCENKNPFNLHYQVTALTSILRKTDKSNSDGVRNQFLLKLSCGCTGNNIQGVTLKEAIVSLHKIFLAEQGYVARSQVTRRGRLVIQNFKELAIHSKEKVAAAMSNFLPFFHHQKRITLKFFLV